MYKENNIRATDTQLLTKVIG